MEKRSPYSSVDNLPEVTPPKILPRTYFAAARFFESQGLLGKAIHQYRRAIAVNHSYAQAYHRLGLLLCATGSREEGVRSLGRAVALQPDDAVFRNNLGFELLMSNRLDEAVTELTRAVELKPDFARARINLGLVLGRLERFDEALASFRKALSEADAQYNLGLVYRIQEFNDKATDAFRVALSANPRLNAARVQLDQLASQGRVDPSPSAKQSAPRTDTRPIMLAKPAASAAPTDTTSQELLRSGKANHGVAIVLQDAGQTREPATDVETMRIEARHDSAPLLRKGRLNDLSVRLRETLARLQRLEDRLSIVRNEIVCLESVEDEGTPSVLFAGVSNPKPGATANVTTPVDTAPAKKP